MLKHIHWSHYLKYGALAAILFSIPLIFFLRDPSFTQTWLLYIGNFLFLVVVTISLFIFNNERHQNASTVTMLTAGHIVAFVGVLFACAIAFVLLLFYVPDIFSPGPAHTVLTDSPANMVKDKTNGLAFIVFMDAIFGNISAGSFVSIIFPFTLKKDQTKEKVPRKQAEL